MSDAEVMATAITATPYFGRNFELARRFLANYSYLANMLDKSRFSRRVHRIADLFLTLFNRLGETWKALNKRSIYIVDSFPVPHSSK